MTTEEFNYFFYDLINVELDSEELTTKDEINWKLLLNSNKEISISTKIRLCINPSTGDYLGIYTVDKRYIPISAILTIQILS